MNTKTTTTTQSDRQRLLIQNLLMLTLVTGLLGMSATRLSLHTPTCKAPAMVQNTVSHGSYFKTLGEKFTHPYVATWKQFTSSHVAATTSVELPVVNNSKNPTNFFSVSPLSILFSWSIY